MSAFFHWSKFLQILKDVVHNQNKFKILIFISKDWLDDPKVDCITLFNLMLFIEMDMELK